MTVRWAFRIALILLAGLAWSVQGQTDPLPALSEEEVVRLFVQGMVEDELIRKIETSPGEYDLSDEMLDELRIAGIPDAVLRAMIQRQAELHPAIEEPETSVESGAPRLVVRLNPDWKATEERPLPSLRTLDAMDPELAQRLGLRSTDLPITDMAIALFCRTADHVPDHWRSKTPLGRDFVLVPRHRMLVFVSGAESSPAGKLRKTFNKLLMAPGVRDSLADLNVLSLEIPERLGVELEPGVAHDLMLGIALNIGNRNYLTLVDERDGVILADGGETTLAAILRGGSKNPLKARVEFLDDPGSN